MTVAFSTFGTKAAPAPIDPRLRECCVVAIAVVFCGEAVQAKRSSAFVATRLSSCYDDRLECPPHQVDEAARVTPALLDTEPGIHSIVEDERSS